MHEALKATFVLQVHGRIRRRPLPDAHGYEQVGRRRKITYGLRMQLSGDGTSRATARWKATKRRWSPYADALVIDQLHATRCARAAR